jgi:hypothetical protein
MGSSSQGSRQSLSGLSLRIRSTLSSTISLHLYRFTFGPSPRSWTFSLLRRLTGIIPIWVSSSYQKRAVKQRSSHDTGGGDCAFSSVEGNRMSRFGGMEEDQAITKGQSGRMGSLPSGRFHPSGLNQNLLLRMTFCAEGRARRFARLLEIPMTIPAIVVKGLF